MSSTELPLKEPTEFYGYNHLTKEEKRVKDTHPLCSFCSSRHSECTIPEEQLECRLYGRYSNGDTYHPKSLTHKVGLFFICPVFGIICVLLVLSTALDVSTLSRLFPYLAAGGFACFGLVFLLMRILRNK